MRVSGRRFSPSEIFGGREATTRNTSAVHRLQKDGTGQSIILMWYAKNLGWSDGLIVHLKLYESCISAHCLNNSCMLCFSFCLLPSSFFFSPIYPFFLFSRPLARVVISGGQNVSPLVSLQSLQANVLTLEAPLVDIFLYFCARNS